MKVICGIYIIISPWGEVYIGESGNILKRWFEDYFKLRNCNKQPRLYGSFLQHGVLNHIFQIIEECPFEDLKKRERFWQDFYQVVESKGLNCKYTKTNEKKQIISEETKKKLSEINMRHVVSEETRNKIRIGHLGKKHTEESKQKMREILMGNKRSLGYKHTEETKLKMSIGSKGIGLGRKMSEEAKKKISEGRKGQIHSKEIQDKITIQLYKSVLQYDLQGNFIKEWESIQGKNGAATILKIDSSSISKCCRQKLKTTGGFIWKYKEMKQ